MKKNNIKKGVSLVSIVIIIVVMIILSTIIVSYSLDSVNSGNISMFGAEITNIQTEVDNYYLRNSTYPIGESIEYTVPNNTSDFDGESLVNGKITLNKINYSLIGIKNLQFGNENKTNDKYAISTTTGKVYYLLGISYKSHTYYTITDEFVNILGVNYKKQVGYKDVVEYDVIFSVSNTNPTNIPVTVTVKIPKAATVNSVTATNSKEVGSETSNDIYKLYMINSTGENRNGNYDITVNYTLNGVTKTANYSVTNFNITSPVITYTSEINNGLRTVTVNVTGDNIVRLKYETASISDVTYFENYGKVIKANSFIIPKDSMYTIYAIDKNGNSTLAGVLPYDMNIGDYVEYNVAYTDVLQNANEYSSLNGWRFVNGTKNSDNTYSDVIMMSTGVPAKVSLDQYSQVSTKYWYVTENDKLEEFKTVLTSLGDGKYNFYSNNSNYLALQQSAGFYYNFSDIKFMYSTVTRNSNLGTFVNIASNGVEYNVNTNSTMEKTGGELFNLIGNEKANVRLLTVPEVNIALGFSDIDRVSSSSPEDTLGLYKLQGLTNVPNMENFVQYTEGAFWLASPWSNSTFSQYVLLQRTNGGITIDSPVYFGVRPAIVLKSGVKVKFIDTNNNNVPEIVIVN